MTERWTESLAYEVGRIVFAFAPDDDRRQIIRDLADRVEAALKGVEDLKAVVEYYADRNVWRGDTIDPDDCSEVTAYGLDDFTETVGGKRARKSLDSVTKPSERGYT